MRRGAARAEVRELDGIRIILRLVNHSKDFRLDSEFNEKLLEGFRQ